MTHRQIRTAALVALLSTALGWTGCGYFLYPERRGNTGGPLDGGTLVMDILWLLPGIVPGVIALIVDFSSGAIYLGGRARIGVVIPADGHVAVALPALPRATELDLRVVTSAQRIVAHRTVLLGPSAEGQSVVLQVAPAERPAADEKTFIEVVLVAKRGA